MVQGKGSGRNDRDVGNNLAAQLHYGTLAELPFYLPHRQFDSLLLVRGYAIHKYPPSVIVS